MLGEKEAERNAPWPSQPRFAPAVGDEEGFFLGGRGDGWANVYGKVLFKRRLSSASPPPLPSIRAGSRNVGQRSHDGHQMDGRPTLQKKEGEEQRQYPTTTFNRQ